MEKVEMQPFISEARNDLISEEDDGLYEEFRAVTENQEEKRLREFGKLNNSKTEPSKVENDPIYEEDDGIYEVPYSSANEGRVSANSPGRILKLRSQSRDFEVRMSEFKLEKGKITRLKENLGN